MFEWIGENIGTIVICLVLAAIVAAIIIKLIMNKKKGKSSCGCNFSHCGMADSCHKK